MLLCFCFQCTSFHFSSTLKLCSIYFGKALACAGGACDIKFILYVCLLKALACAGGACEEAAAVGGDVRRTWTREE